MLRVGIALLTFGFVGASARAEAADKASDQPDTEEAEVVEAAAAEASAADDAPAAVANKSRKSKKSRSKRSRSRGRPKITGHVVPEERLRQTPLPQPSGNLHLVSLASNESIKVNIYNEDGSYNSDALKQVAHILRCKRTETEREIEPRVITMLSHVYDHYGGRRLEVVSGFRNQRRETSYHYQASAVDIRVPGIKPTKVRAFVETLDQGGMGIGLYPTTQFVHIDVRPPPSYRWIDYSDADPNNAGKRPPRGFKKARKPVS